MTCVSGKPNLAAPCRRRGMPSQSRMRLAISIFSVDSLQTPLTARSVTKLNLRWHRAERAQREIVECPGLNNRAPQFVTFEVIVFCPEHQARGRALCPWQSTSFVLPKSEQSSSISKITGVLASNYIWTLGHTLRGLPRQTTMRSRLPISLARETAAGTVVWAETWAG